MRDSSGSLPGTLVICRMSESPTATATQMNAWAIASRGDMNQELLIHLARTSRKNGARRRNDRRVDDGRSTVDGKNEKREKTQKGSIEPITAINHQIINNSLKICVVGGL